MAENRYLAAMGFNTPESRPQTELSVRGFVGFSASKAPAIAGAFLARKTWDYAKKKWPDHKRGVKFVGSVFTFICAYALHVAAGKVDALRSQARLIDRVTDGMCGLIGPDIWDTLKSFWPEGKDKKAAPAAGPGRAEGIDGNDDDIRDVAALMANSPETIRFMGSAMFDSMAAEGVSMNEGARDAIVRSMQQVSQQMAR
jgi:hypothetical protein